jgi:hypothetical protein
MIILIWFLKRIWGIFPLRCFLRLWVVRTLHNSQTAGPSLVGCPGSFKHGNETSSSIKGVFCFCLSERTDNFCTTTLIYGVSYWFLREREGDVIDWIQLASDGGPMNTARTLRVPLGSGDLLTAWASISSPRTLCHGLLLKSVALSFQSHTCIKY